MTERTSIGLGTYVVLKIMSKVEEKRRKRTLTACFLRVTLLDVLAGFRRVHLAAVRTAEVLQMSTEGLQCGVDSSVCTQDGLVLIRKGFIFVELRK